MASAGMPRMTSSLASCPGLCAGAGKDQGAVNGFDLEETSEGVDLVTLVDKVIALFNVRGGESASFNSDSLRVPHEAICQFANPRGHGGAEESSLTFSRSRRKNLFDFFDESHVEHFIRLIEDDGLDLAQVEDVTLEQIVQTAGRANDNIHAAFEAVDLRAVGLAAIDSKHTHVEMLAIFGSSNRQLASASSRVGASTNACGFFCRSKLLRMGRAKAAVLPVPVWA
jgi:hypothetical protein